MRVIAISSTRNAVSHLVKPLQLSVKVEGLSFGVWTTQAVPGIEWNPRIRFSGREFSFTYLVKSYMRVFDVYILHVGPNWRPDWLSESVVELVKKEGVKEILVITSTKNLPQIKGITFLPEDAGRDDLLGALHIL